MASLRGNYGQWHIWTGSEASPLYSYIGTTTNSGCALNPRRSSSSMLSDTAANIALPPLPAYARSLVVAYFAVSTFFVISGYVLSTKPMSLIHAGGLCAVSSVAAYVHPAHLRYLPLHDVLASLWRTLDRRGEAEADVWAGTLGVVS
jgi:hypothetical protein